MVVELLVVIMIITILAGLLSIGLARAKSMANQVVCLNNQRQLSVGYSAYASDNDGRSMSSITDIAPTDPDNIMYTWAMFGGYPGYLYSNRLASKWRIKQATDISGLKKYRMWPYIQSTSVYKCPSDKYRIKADGVSLTEILSYGMNFFVYQSTHREYRIEAKFRSEFFSRVTEFNYHPLGPSGVFIFIEHPAGYSASQSYIIFKKTGRFAIAEHPGFRHKNGAIISFADGHSDHRKWSEDETDPANKIPIDKWGRIEPKHDNRDFNWLWERATFPKYQ